MTCVTQHTDREAKIRASEAAARALSARLAADGVVTLRTAADELGRDYATLSKWNRRHRPACVRAGPRGTRVVRLDELHDELERWRCSWEDDGKRCDEYALLSQCGRCRRHAAAVPRRGRVSSTDFAAELHINWCDLEKRLEADEVPGERIDRGGRPVCWLLDRDEALAALEGFRCRWRDGCKRYALGESRHCSHHAGAATGIANPRVEKITVVCTGCDRDLVGYPSQITREGTLCHACNLADPGFSEKGREAVRVARAQVIARLAADGLVPQHEIAAHYGVAPTSLAGRLEAGGVHLERHLGVVLIDKDQADRHRRDRLRVDGRARAALNLDREIRRLEAAGLLVTTKQLRVLEERFQVRRAWLQRLSSGHPRADDLRQRWLAMVPIARNDLLDQFERELAAEHSDARAPLAGDALLEVAQRDWLSHPEDWPRKRYPEALDDAAALHPKCRKRARERVRTLIGTPAI